jgi:hypothetical protein
MQDEEKTIEPRRIPKKRSAQKVCGICNHPIQSNERSYYIVTGQGTYWRHAVPWDCIFKRWVEYVTPADPEG